MFCSCFVKNQEPIIKIKLPIGAYDFIKMLDEAQTPELLIDEYVRRFGLELARINIPFGYSYFLYKDMPEKIEQYLEKLERLING